MKNDFFLVIFFKNHFQKASQWKTIFLKFEFFKNHFQKATQWKMIYFWVIFFKDHFHKITQWKTIYFWVIFFKDHFQKAGQWKMIFLNLKFLKKTGIKFLAKKSFQSVCALSFYDCLLEVALLRTGQSSLDRFERRFTSYPRTGDFVAYRSVVRRDSPSHSTGWTLRRPQYTSSRRSTNSTIQIDQRMIVFFILLSH